ncbi:PhnD/SsuA/transferrin family substrate-binding protein [Vibrio sp. SCSIO 43135]|uniref:sensor histidine kinase n=1 Tax=Vibrio sp. SCSIO 43135 TaxID=2819096 RepID=UPI0020751B34|nr:sensor histidine kinase [Vibrio sp. SCSIO 43135]USD40087.1 PhnD/SsuA/transferrin family substrate-binding protein [Vibrio sp. SCSIO 43135]
MSSSFIRIILTIVLCTLFTKTHASLSQTTESKPIKVGVLAVRGEAKALSDWGPTIDWFNTQQPEVSFELVPLNLPEVQAAVEAQDIDYLITNAAQSVFLSRKYSASWLATLKSQRANGSLYATGGALVVLQESLFEDLGDLQGKIISLMNVKQVGGHTLFRQKFSQIGIDADTYFDQIISPGYPADLGLYMLKFGVVDAAIVPVCLMEEMDEEGFIDIDEFRVLEAKTYAGFPCSISTKLYPNWSFVRMPWTDEDISKKLTQNLLAIEKGSPVALASGSHGWSIPLSQKDVEDVLFDLEIHPYHEEWWEAAYDWFRREWELLSTIILMLVLFVGYSIIREVLYVRSRNQLIRTQEALTKKNAQLARQEKLLSVSELGSNIAHEINQPLTAISNFSQLGELKLSAPSADESIKALFSKIHSQAEHAGRVVSMLRSKIKKEDLQLEEIDVATFIDEVMAYVLMHQQQTVVQIRLEKQLPVSNGIFDPIGVQQVVVNLVKNAIESCTEKRSTYTDYRPIVTVICETDEHNIRLWVRDNGLGLASEQHGMPEIFTSTKEGGMGLGLSICTDIVERHGGKFTLKNNTKAEGCCGYVELPRVPEVSQK